MIKLFFVVLLFLPCVSYALNVPLEVKERAGVDRTASPITYGVPIAERENVTDVNTLSISGIDAQFSVLSRYDGTPDDTSAPIRVVLVDLQTDMTASQTKTVYLTDTGSGTVSSPNMAIDQAGYIEIDTGIATFRISETEANLFERVIVGSTTVIDAPTADGFFIDYNGTTYGSIYTAPTAVEIEENGPLRCVIKVEGDFTDASQNDLLPPTARGGAVPDTPIRYRYRYYFYKNKSYVKLHATLRNENLGWSSVASIGTHNININTAYLKTTLTELGTSKTLSIDGYSDTFTTANYDLLQQETSDGSNQSYAWDWTLEKNSSPVDSGAQYDSYFDLRDSSMGLMVADRWFWQNHPVGISVTDNQLFFNLWPDLASDHRILGSIWKTHELVYNFHTTDTIFDEELVDLKQRLILRADDTYYADTDFFTDLIPGSITSSHTFTAGSSLQDAIDRYQTSIRAKFDETYITQSSTFSLPQLRDGRMIPLVASPIEYASWYGWMYFGSFPRWWNGFGYGNQHYDWGYIAHIAFQRFEDYEFFDIAEELINHYADILVLHDPDATSGDAYHYHGGHRYEQDALFNYLDDISVSEQTAVKKFSHFWTNQLGMQYLTTGDRRYYDAFMHSLTHCMRRGPSMTDAETRNQTRAIAGLVNGYWITGESIYLNTAWSIYTTGMYSRVVDHAEGEQWINAENLTPVQQRLGMDTMMVHAIVKLREALISAGQTTNATTLETFIIKWATHIRDSVYPLHTTGAPGTYRNSDIEYHTYNGYSNIYIDTWQWVGTTPNSNISLTYCDLFAVAYNITEDTAWMDLARSVFKDAVMYSSTIGWATLANPQTTIHGIWLNHGDAWAKVGQICTRGRYFLDTEMDSNSFNPPIDPPDESSGGGCFLAQDL